MLRNELVETIEGFEDLPARFVLDNGESKIIYVKKILNESVRGIGVTSGKPVLLSISDIKLIDYENLEVAVKSDVQHEESSNEKIIEDKILNYILKDVNYLEITVNGAYNFFCNIYGKENCSKYRDIINSIDYAKKNHEYTINSDRVKKAIKNLELNCTITNLSNAIIGAIFYELEEYDKALIKFVASTYYSAAYYTANKMGNAADAYKYGKLAIKNNDYDYCIICNICYFALKNNDKKLLTELYKICIEYKSIILLFLACYEHVALLLPDKENFSNVANMSFLQDTFNKNQTLAIEELLPEESKHDILEHEVRLTGRIIGFIEARKFGRIRCNENDEVYSFSLAQVSDSQLQNLIQKNPYTRYKVNFLLGINNEGNYAGDDIKLDNIADNNDDKSNISNSVDVHKGYISSFNNWNNYGYVVDENGNEYGFLLNSVKNYALKRDIIAGENFANLQIKFTVKTIPDKKNGVKEVANAITLMRDEIEKLTENDCKLAFVRNVEVVEYIPLKRIDINSITVQKDTSSGKNQPPKKKVTNKIINSSTNGIIPAYFYNMRNSKTDLSVLLDNNVPDIHKERILNRLVDYFITSQNKEKAYEFLKDIDEDKLKNIGINLEKAFYLKLEIRLYDWLKDYSRLIQCYNDIIPMTVDVSRKLHYIQAKAISLLGENSSEKNKAEAAEEYEKWMKIRKSNALVLGLRNPTNDVAGIFVRKQLAKIYIALNKRPEAEKLIQGLKKDNPNDATIEDIIKIDSNIENLSSNVDVKSNTTDNPWDLPLFLVRIVNKFKLTEIVSQRDLLENQYIKDYKSACSYIGKIDNISTLKAKEKADHCIAGIKMLGQLWNDKKIPEGEEEFCKKTIEKIGPAGTLALADSVAADESIDVDVMRFYYVKGLELWRRTGQPSQQEVNACVRYISSYFVDRAGIKLGMEGNKNLTLKDISEYLNQNLNFDGKIETFINGCLTLIYHTNSNLLSASLLAEKLYNSNLKDGVIETYRINSSSDDFKGLLQNLLHDYKKNYTEWDSNFKSLPVFQINSSCVENVLNKMLRLKECNLDTLFKLDLDRLNDIIWCIENLQTYIRAYDASFEDRDRLLQDVLHRCENLIRHIDREPTEYSLNYYLPMIGNIKDSVDKVREDLYENSAPEVTLKSIDTSVHLTQCLITMNMVISNSDHKQQATDIVLESGTDDIEVISDNNLQRKAVNGGGKDSAIIELKLGERYRNEKAFTLKLNYTYRYRTLDGGSKEYRNYYMTTVQISDNFVEINNPFSAIVHAGAVKNVDMIYGREELKDSIIEKIDRFRQPKSILLWGQKRTGKSTVLSYLEKELDDEYYDDVLIINCGEITEISPHTVEAFRSCILTKIEEALLDTLDDDSNSKYQDIIDALSDMRYDVTGYVSESEVNDKFNFFFNSYKRIKIKKPSIVLLLDEFTIIYHWIKKREGNFDLSFIKWWRGFLDNNGIVAVMIGQDYMMKFVYLDPNGFGAIDQIKVTYLDREGFKNLLEQPVLIPGSQESRFREDAIESIWKLTAGSAFFTVIICSRIIDYLNKKKLNYVTNAVIEDVVTELINGQDPIELTDFDSLYNDEGYIDDDTRKDDCLNILKAIAFKASPTTQICTQEDIYDCCVNDFAMDKLRITELLEDLKYRDVLMYNNVNNKSSYKIIVGLFYKYLVVKG